MLALVMLLLHPLSIGAFVTTLPPTITRQKSAVPLLFMADTVTEESTTKSTFGNWQELHGNFLLRPSPSQGPPRALLHFLGGAIVGAAPQVTYRYMLERLANEGFLVVATPYNLSFDHLATCDIVIEKFERIAPMLARQYGAVPVVGVGHSCGALLQLLITSLFPDTPRAANALLSFNNKPVTEAVPFFEEVFAPLFTTFAATNGTLPSSTEILAVQLELARAVADGELPSDELLTRLAKDYAIGPLQNIVPKHVEIPQAVRDAYSALTSPATNALTSSGLIPYSDQTIAILQQIPPLIEEVANGARDFNPSPSIVRAAARRSYRARRTLIVQYNDDNLDESDEIEDLLIEAERVTRMKRPMINIDVQKVELEGGHATPLLAPPLDIATRAQDLLGESASERLFFEQADATVDILVKWLEEGSL